MLCTMKVIFSVASSNRVTETAKDLDWVNWEPQHLLLV